MVTEISITLLAIASIINFYVSYKIQKDIEAITENINVLFDKLPPKK